MIPTIISLMPVAVWIVFCVAAGIEMRRKQKALDEAYELYIGRLRGREE